LYTLQSYAENVSSSQKRSCELIFSCSLFKEKHTRTHLRLRPFKKKPEIRSIASKMLTVSSQQGWKTKLGTHQATCPSWNELQKVFLSSYSGSYSSLTTRCSA